MWSATSASPRSQDKHGFLDDPVQQVTCPDRQSSEISAVVTHQHPEDVPIAKKNRWKHVWVTSAVTNRRDTTLMYTWDGEKMRHVPNYKETVTWSATAASPPSQDKHDG